MQPDATLITRVFGEAGVDYSLEPTESLGAVVRIAPADAPVALASLKACSHSYTFLVDLFGIDTGEAVDVVYHVRSFVFDDEIHLKAAHPYGSAIHSVWEVHPAALLPERECAELFGLTLACHPNPKRLLTIEGMQPLLRKDVAIRTAEEVRDR